MTEKVPHFVVGKSAKFGGAKTMQEWVSLQESSRELRRKTCNVFAAALGVRPRPRAALIYCEYQKDRRLFLLALRYQYETRFNNELLLRDRAI
jgi:hypothetical protein